MSQPLRKRTRADYEQGLPGHHDPTAGFAGAAPARSALTLRLVLAASGLVLLTAGGFVALASPAPVVVAVVFWVLAVGAAVNVAVVARRKARGEPG